MMREIKDFYLLANRIRKDSESSKQSLSMIPEIFGDNRESNIFDRHSAKISASLHMGFNE